MIIIVGKFIDTVSIIEYTFEYLVNVFKFIFRVYILDVLFVNLFEIVTLLVLAVLNVFVLQVLRA